MAIKTLTALALAAILGIGALSIRPANAYHCFTTCSADGRACNTNCN
jgi:hypothetical protein